MEGPSSLDLSWQRCIGWIGLSVVFHIAVLLLLPSLPSGGNPAARTPADVTLRIGETKEPAMKAMSRTTPSGVPRNAPSDLLSRQTKTSRETPNHNAVARTSTVEKAASRAHDARSNTPPAVDESASHTAPTPPASPSELMAQSTNTTSDPSTLTPTAETFSAADTADTKANLHPEPVTDVRGLVAHIHALIKRNANYPTLAKRRGWQGEVLVGFRINSTGTIENVRVALRSGYPVLDAAAIKALRGLGTIPDVAHWLPRGALELELALVYRLTDG